LPHRLGNAVQDRVLEQQLPLVRTNDKSVTNNCGKVTIRLLS
jgi:hypothetical protein